MPENLEMLNILDKIVDLDSQNVQLVNKNKNYEQKNSQLR